MSPRTDRFPSWLSPFVYLSNNFISMVGVVLVTTATVFWLFLLPTTLKGETQHPYIGILTFMVLPGLFFLALFLIPLGMLLRVRRERRAGTFPATLPPLDLKNPELRRLLIFIGVTTIANIIITSQLTYGAITYMDSVTFCGTTCHTVMQPEYAAYQHSPHARVECVACHIGPGASWFVRSKLSGVGQVFAVTFNTYPRPIPTPVRNLRPARETCEACHWPQKFGEDRLRIIPKYADDDKNSLTKTVLLMRIGGGSHGPGIHGAHLGPGITISYSPSDESRQTIPRVEYTNSTTGRKAVYMAGDAKPDQVAKLPTRVMDCMDCHNRPTHTYEMPERALDGAMATGEVSPALPFAKKKALEILKASYKSNAEATSAIPAAFAAYYRDNHADVYNQQRAAIERGGKALAAIYNRNVFPAMRVNWGSYPNNLGHMDFPGCFRCHDGNHSTANGAASITQDCNACHQMLAMDEPNPKILTDLGLTSGTPQVEGAGQTPATSSAK